MYTGCRPASVPGLNRLQLPFGTDARDAADVGERRRRVAVVHGVERQRQLVAQAGVDRQIVPTRQLSCAKKPH